MDFLIDPLTLIIVDLISRIAASYGILNLASNVDFVVVVKAIVIALMMIIPNSIVLSKMIEKKSYALPLVDKTIKSPVVKIPVVATDAANQNVPSNTPTQ